MTDPTLYRYYLPPINGEGWAIVVLGSDGYFSSISDYGNYAYLWTHHGCKDFRQFLLHPEKHWDYFYSKLSPVRRVYAGDETRKGVWAKLIQKRRARAITAEEARECWEAARDIDNHEEAFYRWSEEQSIFDDSWDMMVYEPEIQCKQFVLKVMTRLSDLLVKEGIKREE